MTKYTESDLVAMVSGFRRMSSESRWLEFKSNLDDTERIAKYVSGLANAACYDGRDAGYLIWGIDDKTHEVRETDFDPDKLTHERQTLRMWLRSKLKPEVRFEFFPFVYEGARIVLLEVEAAYRRPVTFDGKAWMRDGTSLTELAKVPGAAETIYRKVGHDWSGGVVHAAKLSDLDPKALAVARKMYSDKHKGDDFAAEIAGWSDTEFLNKARLAIDGKVTRAALLLLGRRESEYLIAPAVAKISWHLKDKDGNTLDYAHFGVPFLTAVDAVLKKIRNITLRVMPGGTLFPVEISQYDDWVLREAIHNCIAHQNYDMCRNIVITESPDSVRIANAGAFLPGDIDRVLHDDGRPRRYPNQQLVDAMVELKMIDTLGSGIHRMFVKQRERFMPMPDYDFSNESVVLDISGKVLDERYCRILIKETNLGLDDIILLDRVQKQFPLSRNEASRLRKKGLIAGRYPRVYPAAVVAEKAERIEEYLDAKGYDDKFYMQRVLEFVCMKKGATRSQIEKLLLKHSSSVLSLQQKKDKISRLLSVKMSKQNGLIVNMGTRHDSCWVITDKGRMVCKKGNSSCKKGMCTGQSR